MRLCLFIALLLFPLVQAVNPVKIPILLNQLNVHTRKLTKNPLPKFQGAPAKILSIIPRGQDLYVCTIVHIYRVKPDGSYSLFLDVEKAFRQTNGRDLNYVNKAHGGVRSIAFHPRFNKNGLFYISAMEDPPSNPANFNYISRVPQGEAPIPAESVLVEYKVNLSTMKPILSSYRNLFRVQMLKFDHPIKQIAFRGKFLYIAHGDGSEQSATVGGGQNNDALGKILRINPRKTKNAPYRIPKDNPFRNGAEFPPEVFAVGFRNPHHICFSEDGTLFAADSGRDNIEEVNIVLKGKNYGWSQREGTFVHKTVGGIVRGIDPLPANDARFGYEYPVIQVGHEGRFGAGFVGQAIAGGCPIENGSPMSGKYWYSDFPETGKLYFSNLDEIRNAVTRGRPRRLTQARTRQAKIFFDHDNDGRTPPLMFDTLGDVFRSDPGRASQERVDVRFGRGSRGELYWSSKRNGHVYIFTSSLPGGPGGPP